jgi:hypothetical protein
MKAKLAKRPDTVRNAGIELVTKAVPFGVTQQTLCNFDAKNLWHLKST